MFEMNDSDEYKSRFSHADFKFLSRRPDENSRWRLPKRYVISILLGLALFLSSWMTTNFSTAVYHMLTTHQYAREFFPNEYLWTIDDLHLMDSSYYWGYFVGQVPGALLVMKYSAHSVIFLAMLLTSLLHMAMPLALSYHPGVILTLNLMQGLSQAATRPAAMAILSQWTPPSENARLVTITSSGFYFGVLFGFPFSMKLVEQLGEEISYFTTGVAGLIWCLLWTCHTYDKPTQDPLITTKELEYLEETISLDANASNDLKLIPMKSMLKSKPLWAICLASVCFQACLIISLAVTFHLGTQPGLEYFFATLPLPYVCISLAIPFSGFLSDYFVNKGCLSVEVARKLFSCGAFIILSSITVAITVSQNGFTTFILLKAGFVCLGLAVVGFEVNILDVCRRYAALATGISLTLGSLPSLIIPLIIEKIPMPSFEERGHPFHYVAIILSALTACVYGYCACGETQYWAKLEQHQNEEQQSTYRPGAQYYPTEEEDDEQLVDENSSL